MKNYLYKIQEKFQESIEFNKLNWKMKKITINVLQKATKVSLIFNFENKIN